MSNTPKKPNLLFKSALIGASAIFLVAGSGCLTTAVLEGTKGRVHTTKKTIKHVLIEDELVAFGKPARALPNMPADSVVIVGNQKSYVLSTGGPEMVGILTGLTPENIEVDSDMTFYSPKNDGYFKGEMRMSYAKPKNSFNQNEFRVFNNYAAKSCSKTSDTNAGLERYCFKVPIEGGVFPKVSNFNTVKSQFKALTKEYPVVVYTTTTETEKKRKGGNLGGLVLLPFAVAFDVVTTPLFLIMLNEAHY